MVEGRHAIWRVGRAPARCGREMVFARLRGDLLRPRADAGREDSGGQTAKGSHLERRKERETAIGRNINLATAFGVRELGILLANSGVGRMGGGDVRQTSVCRWLPTLAHCRKPRQIEACRTFSEFASSIS